MNKNAIRSLLLAAGIFAAAFLIDWLLSIPGIALIVFGAVVGVVVGTMSYRNAPLVNVSVQVNNRTVNAVPAQPIDPRAAAAARREPEVREALGKLANLNLQIRMAGLDGRVTTKVEEIIDKIIATIVPLNNKFPIDNLTAVFNRTANTYMAGLIKEYIDLDPTNREATVETFLGRLNALAEVIDRAHTAVLDNERTEFDIEAAFIRERLNME